MLKTGLTHPALLAALSAAGHGSRVLIADGNYPASTASNPAATVVELSITADVPTVSELLALILQLVPVEGGAVMSSATGTVAAHEEYADRLSPLVLRQLSREDFYAEARGTDVAVVVTTGDRRPFSNLMLTVGVS